MATVFSYDPFQNAPSQPLLTANEQAFLNGSQITTVGSDSDGVDVTTFVGTQTLDVDSTDDFNLQSTQSQDVFRYINAANINGSIEPPLNPSNTDGFIFVATSTGVALIAYQGITDTSFTNVTYVSGQPGTLSTGGAVISATTNYYLMTGVASRITGSIFSDQAGTLAILQSFDGVNWDIGNTITVDANTVNAGIDQEVIAPYLSFLYSNGDTDQGIFRLHIRVFGNGRQGA